MKVRFTTIVLSLIFFLCGTQLSAQRTDYLVIINDMGQHAVWAAATPAPKGWKATAHKGSLTKCTKAIQKTWTDMRPLSIQKEFGKDDAYRVVINHEEQYMIWPYAKKIPEGWKSGDVTGTLGACQDYIEEVWTDMRPLSLRKKLKERNQ